MGDKLINIARPDVFRPRSLRFVLACVIIATWALAWPVLSPHIGLTAVPTIQVCIALDSSSSIDNSDYNTMKQGLAASIEDGTVVPQNGAVELTVVQFGGVIYEVPVIVQPTVIDSAAAANAAASAIRAATKIGGFTPTHVAIDTCRQNITGSANFATALKQVINISTDGDPDNQSLTATARDSAVAAGIDEIDLEAIGSSPSIDRMLQIAYPRPGYVAPPFSGAGFVIQVATYADYASAIRQKLQEIIPRPTATVPVGPTATAVGSPAKLYLPVIAGGYLFFFDDFSSTTTAWTNRDSGTVVWSYQNGEYEIYLRNNNSYAWATAPVDNVTNYTIDVDAHRVTGADTAFGILFDRVDSDHFYTFEIYPATGNYVVTKKDGTNWYAIVNWTASSSISTGNTINHLRLRKSGTQVQLYINGNLANTINSAYVSSYRPVGLFVQNWNYAPSAARFDNFRLEGANTGVSGASPLSAPQSSGSYAGEGQGFAR